MMDVLYYLTTIKCSCMVIMVKQSLYKFSVLRVQIALLTCVVLSLSEISSFLLISC